MEEDKSAIGAKPAKLRTQSDPNTHLIRAQSDSRLLGTASKEAKYEEFLVKHKFPNADGISCAKCGKIVRRKEYIYVHTTDLISLCRECAPIPKSFAISRGPGTEEKQTLKHPPSSHKSGTRMSLASVVSDTVQQPPSPRKWYQTGSPSPKDVPNNEVLSKQNLEEQLFGIPQVLRAGVDRRKVRRASEPLKAIPDLKDIIAKYNL